MYLSCKINICQALTWVVQQGRTIQGQWEKTKDVTRLLARLREAVQPLPVKVAGPPVNV